MWRWKCIPTCSADGMCKKPNSAQYRKNSCVKLNKWEFLVIQYKIMQLYFWGFSIPIKIWAYLDLYWLFQRLIKRSEGFWMYWTVIKN